MLSECVTQRISKPKGSDNVAARTLGVALKIILDPTVSRPVFCAVDFSRLPPVDVEHVDMSAVLKELSALRREVRLQDSLVDTLRDEICQLKNLIQVSQASLQQKQ